MLKLMKIKTILNIRINKVEITKTNKMSQLNTIILYKIVNLLITFSLPPLWFPNVKIIK